MKIVENKVLNILFQLAITLGLAGIIMYLIQEIVLVVSNAAYAVLIIIADIIGIFALIAIIVWMFIPKEQELVLNISFILGAAYILIFSFAHFFVVMYRNNNEIFISTGNFLDDFIISGTSFIGLFLVILVTIGVIVFFSMRFKKKEEMAIYEKIVLLLWFVLIAIYDFSGNYYLRQTLDSTTLFGTVNYGITFLPTMLEFVLLLFASILIIIKLFTKSNDKVMMPLLLLLLNMIFFGYTIGSVNTIGFDFTAPARVPAVVGNHFLMIATLAIVLTSFFVLLNRFPQKQATTK
ncbi:MAG: hypothetical protein FK734_17450 [Asgard group archaeon]|nr:hypothetical protein [Asgard group archaeon]